MKWSSAQFVLTGDGFSEAWVTFREGKVTVIIDGIVTTLDNTSGLIKPCVTHAVRVVTHALCKEPVGNHAKRQQRQYKPKLGVVTGKE